MISISVKDKICYVNFDSSFLTDALSIDGNLIVYSIVKFIDGAARCPACSDHGGRRQQYRISRYITEQSTRKEFKLLKRPLLVLVAFFLAGELLCIKSLIISIILSAGILMLALNFYADTNCMPKMSFFQKIALSFFVYLRVFHFFTGAVCCFSANAHSHIYDTHFINAVLQKKIHWMTCLSKAT